MSSYFINGTQLAIAPLNAAAVAISAISNATQGIASTANTPVEGDIVVLEIPGWPYLREAVARVGTVVEDTSFVVEDYDTTKYPAGRGAGVYYAIGAEIPLSQIREFNPGGNEENRATWRYIDDPPGSREHSRRTYKSALALEVVMDEDVSLPWYSALENFSRDNQKVVLIETLPEEKGVILYVGEVSFNTVTSKTIDENKTVTATFTINSEPKRYEVA